MPDARPPIPVLSYDVDPAFGWDDDPAGGGATLTVPPRPAAEALTEAGAALLGSTMCMLALGAAAVALAGSQAVSAPAGSPAPFPFIAVAVGLLAIGLWVLVLLRFIAVARAGGVAATVRVTPAGIEVDGGLPPGPDRLSCRRAEVAGLRLNAVRGFGGRPRGARLQVVTRGGRVASVTLPWPAGEPTEPHEGRMRGALGLGPSLPNDRR